jgi:hypothetical protein
MDGELAYQNMPVALRAKTEIHKMRLFEGILIILSWISYEL